MTTNTQDLGFSIGCCAVRVLTYRSGGCRPATEEEAALWDALRFIEAAAIERCAKRVERAPLDLLGMPAEMRITARAHVADDLRALLPKEE